MPESQETIASCQSCGAAMDVSAVAPYTNVECPKCGEHTRVKREFGPYTLVRRHAVGGMSMVFVARDSTLDREVALKILSENYSADERRIAAFEEEARITASFSHPNVVRVLTTGRAFGRFYIAMELVPGGHFEHQIRERGKIPELEMLPLAIEVAQGLKAAKAAGLIHRDVKPGNILLDAEGHAKLVDFGLALVTQGGKAQAKELWATPYYVPPETVEGDEEDFRSDIYAFGATLYHALAGKPSCGEESMATDVLREAKKRVVPLSLAEPSVSAETCGIVEKAMAYDPDSRFSSYDQMIASLSTSLGNLKNGRAESNDSVSKRREKKKCRDRNTLLIGAAVVLIAAGVAVWALKRPEPKKTTVLPPLVKTVTPPPLVADTSAEIARSYREARKAVEAKEYEKAANAFNDLHKNPAVQEPTRTIAGVESALASFLDGRPSDARRQASETLDHIRSLPEESTHLGGELIKTLGKLNDFTPIKEPADSSSSGAAKVISAMLAGLKNWEQGLLGPAASCFNAVTNAKLSQDDNWAAIYQSLAADYLSDHKQITGPLFDGLPHYPEECAAAIKELDTMIGSLKTRGRARFNVRAWQLDLLRHAKLTGAANSTAPQNPTPHKTNDPLPRIAELARDCRFIEAITFIKALPSDPAGASRASLLAIAESAVVFLADIEDDLAKQPVSTTFQLKSGESMTSIAIDDKGVITATAADGVTRPCKWTDFPPEALIALHRILVKNPKSELERLRRHECAIAYEWLSGDREHALNAASILAQNSPTFKQRWETISSGLPK
jgi:eukaryotic-like serine/threonine-protein kinase